MTFARQMAKAKQELEKLGHSVQLPCDTEIHLTDDKFIDDLDKDYEHCVENDVMRSCMQGVADSDAILVMNYDKNGVKGYIGTSTLMEMGLAHFLRKKIFLLYATPSPKQARWAHEVRIFHPVVIDEDYSKVK